MDFGLDIVHELQQSLYHLVLVHIYICNKLTKLSLSLLLRLLGKIVLRPSILQEKV